MRSDVLDLDLDGQWGGVHLVLGVDTRQQTLVIQILQVIQVSIDTQLLQHTTEDIINIESQPSINTFPTVKGK